MIQVKLGNAAPIHEVVEEIAPEDITTDVVFPEGVEAPEAFITITDPNGVWAAHSTEDPTFVAASDPKLQARLAAFYDCPVKDVPGINTPEA